MVSDGQNEVVPSIPLAHAGTALPAVRRDRVGDLAAGFPRFAHGLFKKVVIADTIAPVADASFGVHSGLTTSTAWMARAWAMLASTS